LLVPSKDKPSNDTRATVYKILLQNENFLECIAHKCFWNSHRPDK
jgi:hypothetical protein